MFAVAKCRRLRIEAGASTRCLLSTAVSDFVHYYCLLYVQGTDTSICFSLSSGPSRVFVAVDKNPEAKKMQFVACFVCGACARTHTCSVVGVLILHGRHPMRRAAIPTANVCWKKRM